MPVVLPAAVTGENSSEFAQAKQIVADARAELANIERERYRGKFPRTIANMVALCFGCIEVDEPATPTVLAYLPHFRELAEAGRLYPTSPASARWLELANSLVPAAVELYDAWYALPIPEPAAVYNARRGI